MSVEQLSDLHRRYVDLSQQFRAAWVFHQFLKSRAKLSGQEEPSSPLLARFQDHYGELKDCSKSLNATEVDSLRGRFDALERGIGEILAALLAEDSKVPPGELRRFFQKYRNYEAKILVQLVRFYLYACGEDDWSADRRDKVDFLVTHVGEEERGTPGSTGRPAQQRLEEILGGFWSLVGAPEQPEEKVAGLRRAVEDIRAELATVESLDDLDRRESLGAYRDFKHSLGMLFFEPSILLAIVDCNLAFREVVRRLYEREEQRIVSEYRQIFDLERGVHPDVDLDRELERFRSQVEEFEQRLQRDDLRLDELAQLRERVRDLVPRLGSAAAAESLLGDADDEPDGREVEPAAGTPVREPDRDPLTGASYRRLIDALGSVSLGSPARAVVHTADLFPFRLEAREVVAYRRLLEAGAAAAGEARAENPGLERFLLEAAALRVCLGEAAETARSLLDQGDGEVASERLRRLAALGDEYVRRFEHLMGEELLAGRPEEAQVLALLRVRLVRDWSDVWLLAHEDLRRAD